MSFSLPFWTPAQATAILFDWDGVIAETRLDFSGIREKYFGGRHVMLLEDACTLPEEIRFAYMQELEDLEVQGAYTADYVTGIENVLEWVRARDIPWAVVSRNCRKSILTAAKVLGIDLPPVARSRDDGRFVKPDPRALAEVCDELEVDPAQTLFLGDFIYDMIGARRIGMRGVLVRSAIEKNWAPWLECAFTSMHELRDELENPGEIVPWEYLNMVGRHGRSAFARIAQSTIHVDDARPDGLDARILRAASLGIGCFEIEADATLRPENWSSHPAFDPADLGKPLAEAVKSLLRTRFPLAEVRPTDKKSGSSIELPNDLHAVTEGVLSLIHR